MTTPLDELAEQIGAAVLDAIEQNRRINKGDLVDAAHSVLRRRRALLAVGQEPTAPSDAYIDKQTPGDVWISQEVWDATFKRGANL